MHSDVPFTGLREMKKSPTPARAHRTGFASLAWCPQTGNVFDTGVRQPQPKPKQLASR
jgi:hypothetical protein